MVKTSSRINTRMNMEQIFNAMSDGNQEAISCMKQMVRNDMVSAIRDLFLLDSLNIYGEQICKLWKECCGQNARKFKATIKAFRERRYTPEQIAENLSHQNPKPFI